MTAERLYYVAIPGSLRTWFLEALQQVHPAYQMSHYTGRDGRPRFVAYGGAKTSPSAIVTADLGELIIELQR
jgi:hypothetical protein